VKKTPPAEELGKKEKRVSRNQQHSVFNSKKEAVGRDNIYTKVLTGGGRVPISLEKRHTKREEETGQPFCGVAGKKNP